MAKAKISRVSMPLENLRIELMEKNGWKTRSKADLEIVKHAKMSMEFESHIKGLLWMGNGKKNARKKRY